MNTNYGVSVKTLSLYTKKSSQSTAVIIFTSFNQVEYSNRYAVSFIWLETWCVTSDTTSDIFKIIVEKTQYDLKNFVS